MDELEKKLERLRDELKALEILQLKEQFKGHDTLVIDHEIEVTEAEIDYVSQQIVEILQKEENKES